MRTIFLLFAIHIAVSSKGQIDTENVLLLGRNAIYFDDYLTAIHNFNQAIEAKPYLSKAYYYRAYAKFSLEDYHGAEADCSTSLELNPFVTEVYKLRALCRIHNQNMQGAIEDYNRVISNTKDDQASIYNRALCNMQIKEYDAAEKDIDYILKKWPLLNKSYVAKAQIALEKNDTIEGLKWIDALLSRYPKDAAAWAFKGRHAIDKGKYEEADTFLTKAIKLNPTEPNYYLSRALAHHALNHFSEALSDYDHIIKLIPEHTIAHYNRGLLRAQLGDDNKAIEDFEVVIKKDPNNTLALYNLAMLQEQTGDYTHAIEHYTTIINSFPNFTYGYLARARMRRKIGDIKGAKKDESYVAKANLDLYYDKKKKTDIKKIRKFSDLDIENYQDLAKDENNSKEELLHELIGKVQNIETQKEIHPHFKFTITPPSTKGYQSVAFLPQIEKINQAQSFQQKVYFAASTSTPTNTSSNKKISLLDHTKTPEEKLYNSILLLTNYQTEEALKEIETAIRLDSLSPVYHIQKSSILTHQAIVENKSNSLTHSLLEEKETETPKASKIWYYHQGTLLSLNKAIELDPQNAYLYYNRGCTYAMVGDRTNALKDFSKAINLYPRFAEAYYNRAVIHLLNNEPDKAIPDLSKAGEMGLYKAYNLLKQATNAIEIKKNEEKTKE